ncbi:phosphoribosylglycinamide formyltransferase [Amylostereum chailletii]|nr:phosphoribosylglycinamide formyltransferase [Amylostereum chailletii]
MCMLTYICSNCKLCSRCQLSTIPTLSCNHLYGKNRNPLDQELFTLVHASHSTTTMADTPRRVVVLISGSGTNLQALIDAQNTPTLPNTRITLVLSNRKAAYGLTRASNAAPPIPTAYLALQPFLKAHPGKTRADYDAEVARIVVREKPDLVVLAGWMHVLGEGFLDVVSGVRTLDGEEPPARPIAVINLHPALPGAFDGAHAIERAYDAFQRGEVSRAGAMVHRVVKEVDRGEPVVVREVEIIKGEPLEAFEERLHKAEWEIIVEGTRKVLEEVKPIA